MIAFPPGMERKEAIELLEDMVGFKNTDGCGYAFVNNEGQFSMRKWTQELKVVLKKHRNNFLGHLPHTCWTIAHLRAASSGAVRWENSHPFIAGDYCIAHNGSFYESNIVRLALSKIINWQGETDSETASQLINIIGPKKFAEEITFGGVYLALQKDGDR